MVELLKANIGIYLLVVFLGFLIPCAWPQLFHPESQLNKYPHKWQLFSHLLWKDATYISVAALIVVSLLIAFHNLSSTLHNPIYSLGGLLALIIWAFIYIWLKTRRR